MSVDIGLDPKTHDLPTQPVLIGGQKRIAQQIKVHLLTFLGEWFLDTTFGVPYFESILIKSPRRAQVESIIRAKIKSVPGVLRVPSIQVKIDNETRESVIEVMNIETVHGNVSVST